MNDLKTIIVVSHTHWDREWYRTFQQFRFDLVDMMDRLLDLLLERSDYEYFLLDGQSVLLEDYLAVRPTRKADLEDLVRSGRLGIGPWYVQPDEFLTSGESLIRNLLLGHRVADSLGPTLKIGWLPDTFGHVAQLPQILLDFGIDVFVSARGLGDHLEDQALEFWWESPDGSRVLALFQHKGYWNAGNLGYPCFWGDIGGRPADPRLALAKIRELATHLAPLAASSTIAVWNGADHMPPQESLPEVISRLNENLDDLRVVHGRVDEYAKAVRESNSDLPMVCGELRGSRYQNIHASVLSSRIHLKQMNHCTQRLLERYAEPLATVAWLAGDTYPSRRLWEAWRLLLQNHPHDSICGCSVDQVNREMISRFEQAQQIGDRVIARALETLAAEIDTSWCPVSTLPLVVFNPLGQARREAVEITLRLPDREAYRATDADGMPAQLEVLSESVQPYHWMHRKMSAGDLASLIPFLRQCLRELDGLDIAGFEWGTDDEGTALHLQLAEWPLASEQVVAELQKESERRAADMEIEIDANYVLTNLALMADLPSCGYSTYAIERTNRRVDDYVSVQGNDRTIENEHLQVSVGPDGRLTVVGVDSDRCFENLHQVEDCADRGDCYDFCPVPDDRGFEIVEEEPDVEVLQATNLVKSIAIRYALRVSSSLTSDEGARSEERIVLPATTVLKLRAGSPYLEIVTTLNNQARDHRLRVLFPTGIDADVVHSDGHFAISTRDAFSNTTGDWHQPASTAQPHHIWFGADDGEVGLAVLSEGLPEHAGLTEPGGLTLALTLLRSVGWLSRGDLTARKGHSGPAKRTPDAQCLGAQSFRYGLLPYEEGPVKAGVPGQASRFDVPPIVGLAKSGPGRLPANQSIVSLEPDSLILTALKRSEKDGRLVIRFYSVARSATEATIRFGFRVAEAHRATASESELQRLELSRDGYACNLEVGPAEIVTVLLRFHIPLATI